jgi:fructokinase
MPSKAGNVTHCVGTGFIALDIIRSTLDKNTIVERRHAGGSCGNVLAILSYLGIRASAVGRIGDDRAGQELLADLCRWKVDVQLLVTEQERRTPAVIQEIFVDARGRARHRFSRMCSVCGATMPGYRPLLAADVAQIADALPVHNFFFFDRVAHGTLELARRSRQQGALVVFEPSGIKDEELFVECLRVSHVLKYSHERLSGLDALVNRGSVLVEIETLGAEGLRFQLCRSRRAKTWQHLPAYRAPAVRDAAGSGDWCTAGFLARIADDGDPVAKLEDSQMVSDSLQFGQALATLNCAYDGARGLMYAVSRAGAVRAAERLLVHDFLRLPRDLSAPPVEPQARQACTICSSDLRTSAPERTWVTIGS